MLSSRRPWTASTVSADTSAAAALTASPWARARRASHIGTVATAISTGSTTSGSTGWMRPSATRVVNGTVTATTSGLSVWAKNTSRASTSATTVVPRSPLRLAVSPAGARRSKAAWTRPRTSARARNAMMWASTDSR